MRFDTGASIQTARTSSETRLATHVKTTTHKILPAPRRWLVMDHPDPLEAESDEDAIAVSQWSADARALAIGNESRQEWIVFDGDTIPVTQ